MAWRRLKLDRPDRSFVIHPFLFTWVEVDLEGCLRGVASKVAGGYTPKDAFTYYVPKGDWMVRPAAVLDLEDELVFIAILGSFYPKLWSALKWSQGDPD